MHPTHTHPLTSLEPTALSSIYSGSHSLLFHTLPSFYLPHLPSATIPSLIPLCPSSSFTTLPSLCPPLHPSLHPSLPSAPRLFPPLPSFCPFLPFAPRLSVDNCSRCGIVLDSVISTVEIINCQRIQAQVSITPCTSPSTKTHTDRH